jgi:hypothetical protein
MSFSTPIKLASLTVEEVCCLLHNLDLGIYEQAFRKESVTGTTLIFVDEIDLEGVGVDNPKHRKSLLCHIDEFRKGGVPPEKLVVRPVDLWTWGRALVWRCL